MGYHGLLWQSMGNYMLLVDIILNNIFQYFKDKKGQRAYKPGFVSKILIVVIHLESLLPNLSSDLPKKLCRNTKFVSSIWSCSKWGLPCHFYCQKCGALLPHHFTLTKKMAVYFLWHFPQGFPCWMLSSTLFLQSPDFPLL